MITAIMEEMGITAILIAASLIIIIVFFLYQSSDTPPGPIGLPIVGYIPFLTSKPYIDLQNLSKTYGSVFSIKLGSRNIIVLSDFQSTKDAFFQDALMGRPPESPFELRKETLETGAFNGLPWKEQRKFSLQMLKELGFGKLHMEDMIQEEISDLLEHFEQSGGRPINPKIALSPSMSNNVAALVFGKRRKYDDPIRIKLDKSLIESAALAGQMGWQLFFPWISKLMRIFQLGKEKQLREAAQDARDIALDEIEEHKKSLDEDNVRDYIDGYLLEIRKRNDPAFCEGVLEDMIPTFFGAGSETVRLTMDWLILLMAAKTDVQQRIHSEIDTVIGGHRLPRWTDNSKMPYTQATIMELMRWRTIIPINILRYTLWDTELNGYFIPKGTIVLANIWAIHHDPKYWGKDVDIFRPERFLSEDQKEVVKPEYFIPFSIGKRSCPGESFARMEVFLYFVALLQKFSICLPKGSSPDFDGILGIGLAPKPYEVCMNKRL